MPISPDSQYILDGHNELMLSTDDVSTFVYSTNYDVDNLVDELENTTGVGYHCNDIMDILYDEYHNWRCMASPAEKACISVQSILQTSRQIDEFLNYFNNKLTHDWMLYHNIPGCDISNKKFTNDIKTIASINDDVVNEYINVPSISNWIRLFVRQYTNFIDDIQHCTLEQIIDCDIQRRNIIRTPITEHRKYKLDMDKKTKRHAIKVMRKSSDLFKQYLGEHKLKAFLSGNGFIVEGSDFNYEFTKSNMDLLKHSANPNINHIPYNLSIMDKNNNKLCNICVYFENTPALDQIIAMVLYIKSTDEDVILQKANVFNRTDYFYEHDTISKLTKTTKPNNLNSSNMFATLTNEQEVKKRQWTNKIKNVIEPKLFNKIDIPTHVLKFIHKPTIQFDELHALPTNVIKEQLTIFDM